MAENPEQMGIYRDGEMRTVNLPLKTTDGHERHRAKRGVRHGYMDPTPRKRPRRNAR